MAVDRTTWPKLTKDEMQAVAPLTRDGKMPDMFNHMPTRFVSRAEAQARGWVHFYMGDVCSYGHKAPRYTKNHRYCIDCARVADGLLPMGGRGEAEKARVALTKRATENGTVAAVARDLEPDSLEKRFIVEYAKERDFDAAARAVNQNPALFHARLSYSRVFREAVDRLEGELNLVRTPSLTEDFEWNDDKRVVLIRTYINTGDLSESLASIGCSNWHYERELQDNPDFAESMQKAEVQAMRWLDRVAISKARAGDSRLLQRVLVAKLPEYSERVKLDVNVTEKLSDEQALERLLLGLEALGVGIDNDPTCIDAEFAEVEPQRALEAPADGGDEGQPAPPESNSDLL